jgi:arylsulfatase A-like enzyme
VPLIVEGPGFEGGRTVSNLVSHVDLMPSFLEAAGVAAPSTVQGRSFLPLVNGKTDGWRDEVYFEMTEFTTGRGLRTPQYTYAVAAPKLPGWKVVQGAPKYTEYMLYDNYADPYQHVNLAGRTPYREVSQQLRQRLLARMREGGDAAATIEPAWFPYP